MDVTETMGALIGLSLTDQALSQPVQTWCDSLTHSLNQSHPGNFMQGDKLYAHFMDCY
jgi:hypothetical protein